MTGQEVCEVTVMKKLIAMAALICGALLLSARPAAACSCVADPPVREMLATSEAVFVATAVNVGDGLDRLAGFRPMAELEVERAWKGAVQKRMYLVQGEVGGGADCSYGFERGQSYLVFASKSKRVPGSPLATSLCSGSAPLDQAQDTLQVLGPATVAIRDVAPTGGGVGWGVWLAVAGGALLPLAAVSILVWKGVMARR